MNASISYIEYDEKCASKWQKRIKSVGKGEDASCSAIYIVRMRATTYLSVKCWSQAHCLLPTSCPAYVTSELTLHFMYYEQEACTLVISPTSAS